MTNFECLKYPILPKQGERRQLCHDLAKIQARCFRAGLYLTAQKMKVAVEQIGYECFEQFETEARLATQKGRQHDDAIQKEISCDNSA